MTAHEGAAGAQINAATGWHRHLAAGNAAAFPQKRVGICMQLVGSNGLWFTRVPQAVIGGVVAACCCCLPAEAMAAFEPIPWLIALVVIGLPHGAADLAVLRHQRSAASAYGLFALALLGMAAVLACLLVAPAVTMAGFLVISIWHFGHAEMTASPSPSPATCVRGAIARGGLVLGLPLLAWPEATLTVADNVLALIAPIRLSLGLSPAGDLIMPPARLAAVGGGLSALAALGWLLEMVDAIRDTGDKTRLQHALADLAGWGLIGLLCLTAPPLLAVGVFFLCWHAWRQLPSVAEHLSGTAAVHSLASVLLRVHVAALPLLMPVWLATGTAWWLLSADHSWRDLALTSLVVYLVVTPSHEMLTALGDGRS